MSLKLTYFDIKGIAEPIRLTLAIGGIDFEDNRVAFDDWQEMKPTTPFGQLPIFQIGETIFAQSEAILRYAGKQAGLYPKDDDLQALAIDQWLGSLTELRTAIAMSVHESDDAKKKEMREKLSKSTVPMWFERLTKAIEMNPTRSGFLVGEKVSIADLVMYAILGWLKQGVLDGIPKSIVAKWPVLMKHCEIIAKMDAVKSFEAQHRG